MKSVFLLLLLLSSAGTLAAQIPLLSPHAHVEQEVGNTTITLDFTRPMARERKIFDGLVPHGKVWQTGAGLSLISFSRMVTINEQIVPAGKYGLLTIPNEKEWTVMLSSDTSYTAYVNYKPVNDVVQFCIPVTKPGRYYDALSLELDITPGKAKLYISWADVQVSFPILTSTEADVMRYVDGLLAAPEVIDADPYFRAVNYLLFNKMELRKALALTNRYREAETGYFIYTMRRDIYVLLDDKSGALQACNNAVEAAKHEFGTKPQQLKSILESLREKREEVEKM